MADAFGARERPSRVSARARHWKPGPWVHKLRKVRPRREDAVTLRMMPSIAGYGAAALMLSINVASAAPAGALPAATFAAAEQVHYHRPVRHRHHAPGGPAHYRVNRYGYGHYVHGPHGRLRRLSGGQCRSARTSDQPRNAVQILAGAMLIAFSAPSDPPRACSQGRGEASAVPLSIEPVPRLEKEIRCTEIARLESERQPAVVERAGPGHAGVDLRPDRETRAAQGLHHRT